MCGLQLQYGSDESYKLSIPGPGKPAYAHLEVGTTNPFVLVVTIIKASFVIYCLVG